MGMNRNYWTEIADCVDYIEHEVNKGSPYSKISSGIDQRYNTRSRVVREAFNACMPYSLGKYMRSCMPVIVPYLLIFKIDLFFCHHFSPRYCYLLFYLI